MRWAAESWVGMGDPLNPGAIEEPLGFLFTTPNTHSRQEDEPSGSGHLVVVVLDHSSCWGSVWAAETDGQDPSEVISAPRSTGCPLELLLIGCGML